MIRYTLHCAKGHDFESWFANSAAFDKQNKRGLVACPVCGSAKVEKAIMAPRLGRADAVAAELPQLPSPPAPMPPAPTGGSMPPVAPGKA
ncbi:MAG: DUF1178 family protein, partial [Xanthobacteraceae bacterium]